MAFLLLSGCLLQLIAESGAYVAPDLRRRRAASSAAAWHSRICNTRTLTFYDDELTATTDSKESQYSLERATGSHHARFSPCGTELIVVQEGVPEVIPAEACYVGWQESLILLAKLVEPEIPD